MLNPQLIERAAEFWTERQHQQFNDAADAEAERAETITAMAFERLKAKIAALSEQDLIGGMHSVTKEKHGRALRAAWLESPEALGDLVMTIIVHAMQEDAELEAERALDRDCPRYASVGCSQCGQKFGPGNAGFSRCADHVGRRVRLFDEL